jgi:dethiobiotin synthetase
VSATGGRQAGFVVTGTDTGIGKTIFSAGLTGHLRATYWKPVQAGIEEESDSERVARLSGRGAVAILPEAYSLATPCSPHRAAEIDGVVIDPARLALPRVEGPLVVEGAGGVLVPLTRDLLYADMFARWGLPVILAARTSLGTINHSLLSLGALRARGVAVAGVVFVGEDNADSEATICAMGGAAHLGRLPWLERLDADSLATAFAAGVRTDLLA